MKYFEKNARDMLGIEKGKKVISKLYAKKGRVNKLKHINADKFYTDKVQNKLHMNSMDIARKNMELNRMKMPKLASTTHPMQGTILNVQTRDAQRKYKSKILGKKRPSILVPLWS